MPVEEKPDNTSTPTSSGKKRKSEGGNGAGLEKTAVHKASGRSNGEVFASVGKGGEGAKGRLWVCDVSCPPLTVSARLMISCASSICRREKDGADTLRVPLRIIGLLYLLTT